MTIIFFKIKMILKMVAGGVEMKVSAGFSRICGLLVGLVLVFTANSTFAAGSVSAEECEAWFADHESETVQLQSDQLGGYLRFFYAQNRLCCHISYLLSSNETIQNSAVAVDITNANRSYSVSFDAAGTDDDPCDITKCFTEPTRVGQDIYFMLEFNEKEDKNTENHADIRLIVNGTSYDIARLEAPYNANTTVKAETSATTTGGKNTKESTTKFVYSGSGSVSNDDSESSTKFKSKSAQSAENPNMADFQAVASADDTGESAVVSVPTEKETDYTPQAKAMFALAGLFAIAGAGFLLHHVIKTRKVQTAAKESAEETKQHCESVVQSELYDGDE